jgi:hypothetical protein
MTSHTTRSFREAFDKLPKNLRALARLIVDSGPNLIK